MKITIIGANSNIARNFIFVNKNKHEIYTYDYQDTHQDGIANYTKVNLNNSDDINQINFDVDVVYFFTGLTGNLGDTTKTNDSITINQLFLVNVLDRMVELGFTGKIIFPSTRLVYKGNDLALKEDSEIELKTSYAISKYSCEKILEMYHLLQNIDYVIVRICIPYGTLINGSKSYGTIGFFMGKALDGKDITIYGDGNQRRTFTYIGDLIELLTLCASTKQIINNVYNIGGENFSLREVAKIISNKYSVNIQYIEWPEISKKIESGNTVFDSSKLDKLVKYCPQYNFQKWINEI